MHDSDTDGVLRHEVPAFAVTRVIFVIFGVAAMGLSVWELHRGVWPPNIASPFFLLLIFGAFAVGLPVMWAGLFGSALQWTVTRGRIEIAMRNPFGVKTRHITPGQIAQISLREHDHDNGPNTWSVLLLTIAGEHFETRDFGSRERAEQLKDRIETLFRG